jgi:kumamolisin
MSSSGSENDKEPIFGSEKSRMGEAKVIGPADPKEIMEVTVMLRHADPNHALAISRENTNRTPAERRYLTREEFATAYGASPNAVEKVKRFAREYGLRIVEDNAAQRVVKLSGNVESFSKIFGVKLTRYEHPRWGSFRGREGPILIPKEISDVVSSVHGLDNRRQAEPHFVIRQQQDGPRKQLESISPQAWTKSIEYAYNFPTGVNGAGQTIGIIEFGGGYTPADLNKYFSGFGMATPNVIAIPVDHAENNPGSPDDGEVELDVEVAGTVAPGATIAVYFAPNTDQGFIDAVRTSIHDSQYNPKIISISWGSDESGWTDMSRNTMDQLFSEGGQLGITVCVASGDHGSSDFFNLTTGSSTPPDGVEHVDFPASSANVLSCGGTTLNISDVTSEVTWNNNNGWAGGGGVSQKFALPAYQNQAGVPVSPVTKKPGRGVPDVSGNADPNTGYDIIVDGKSVESGGTSAVAPLYAGLIALINQSVGVPQGFINPLLYTHADVFNDITSGGNDTVGRGNFQASPGWDPCTGLGSPKGRALLSALSAPIIIGTGPTPGTACATNQAGDLHVLAIDEKDGLWRTIRKADGSWPFAFGDVQAQTRLIGPNPGIGPIKYAACATNQAGDLDVLAIDEKDGLWHTIRKADGTWPFAFGDVQAALPI